MKSEYPSQSNWNGIYEQLHTLCDFVRWGTSQLNQNSLFFGHGTDNAVDEAIILVSDVLNLPANIPDILWHGRLTFDEKLAILTIFERRIKEKIPAAYLTNKSWFAGIEFYVDQRVLIPRSPIAELIEQQFDPWLKTEQVHQVLDLCTGSGCIAIASALLAFPQAKIDAVDISIEALEVANKNIERYSLKQRVKTIRSDLFSNLEQKYDLIICNPPYVDNTELQAMPAEYHHEPKLGLEAGEDGLLFVKRILREASKYLNDEGLLIVEVGLSQTQLEIEYPKVAFLWLEFQRGGTGVFLLTADQLRKYADYL